MENSKDNAAEWLKQFTTNMNNAEPNKTSDEVDDEARKICLDKITDVLNNTHISVDNQELYKMEQWGINPAEKCADSLLQDVILNLIRNYSNIELIKALI